MISRSVDKQPPPRDEGRIKERSNLDIYVRLEPESEFRISLLWFMGSFKEDGMC